MVLNNICLAELTYTLTFRKIQKIVKLFEKFWKKWGAYVYKFFTSVQIFRIKWHSIRSVQKRQNKTLKTCVFKFFSDNSGCLFCTDHMKYHLIMRIYTSVKNLYTYASHFFQNFFFMFYYFFEFCKNKGCRCTRAPFVRTQGNIPY